MFKSTESAAELFQDEEHQNRVATFENKLHQEFVDEQFKPQLQRDADLWYQTLENPGDARVGSILQRICIILRYGGLMYRKDKKSKTWNSWADTKWSIATALSHGGRIVIQLPCGFAIPAATAAKKKTGFLQNVLNKIFDGAMTSTSTNEESHDHAFWYWLITGDPNSKQFESNYVSLMTSGDECEKENKVIFKRLGATHALTYDKSNINKNDFKDEEDDDVEEATDYLEALPYKRYKYIKEIKVKLGVNARDTKVLRSKQVQYQKHRHWGMNIAMGMVIIMLSCCIGGDGNKSHGFNPKAIVERNGSYGHMYLYYMRYVVIGCNCNLLVLDQIAMVVS